ncbi:MAG: hypothetical protein DMG96_43090 [Acidobacteria bacterium]|nr:MAG: hypothetical protein DMG96_43090 [Acidobacteriota bacterium]
MKNLPIAIETFRPNVGDAARANPCGCRNSILRLAESQQRRTQAAIDSSIGEVVLAEELGEHVLLFEAKILVESTATPCWFR